MATTRKTGTDPKTQRTSLTATCPKGHSYTVPDKGLGRAALAAWETRHQSCKEPKK
jgi:hypothetical protein